MVEGKKIPGLGSPNVPESNSVFLLDVSNPAHPEVKARTRTGIPTGPKSVGGSSPGAVLAGTDKVYVSNSAQDSISILDAHTGKEEKTLVLQPAKSLDGLRGLLPFGLALSPDGSRLYVACAGINALAVIDTQQEKVLGYVPTGWFPARVVVSPDGKTLYVDNAKGFGAGPNGGADFHQGPAGDYIGDITRGVVSIMPAPETSQVRRTHRAGASQQRIRSEGGAGAGCGFSRSAGGPCERENQIRGFHRQGEPHVRPASRRSEIRERPAGERRSLAGALWRRRHGERKGRAYLRTRARLSESSRTGRTLWPE